LPLVDYILLPSSNGRRSTFSCSSTSHSATSGAGSALHSLAAKSRTSLVRMASNASSFAGRRYASLHMSHATRHRHQGGHYTFITSIFTFILASYLMTNCQEFFIGKIQSICDPCRVPTALLCRGFPRTKRCRIQPGY
jgi:hypothetical protein